MATGARDKQPVRVFIFGQTFTVVTDEDPRAVEEIAEQVDELMRGIARRGVVDSNRAAVLACLHMADQMRGMRKELDVLRDRVGDKSERLTVLLKLFDEENIS